MSRDLFRRSLSEYDDTLGGLLPSISPSPSASEVVPDLAEGAPGASELADIDAEHRAQQILMRSEAKRRAARMLAEPREPVTDLDLGEPLVEMGDGRSLPESVATAGNPSHRLFPELSTAIPERNTLSGQLLRSVPLAGQAVDFVKEMGNTTPEGITHGLASALTFGHQDELISRAMHPFDDEARNRTLELARERRDLIRERDPSGVMAGGLASIPVFGRVPGAGNFAAKRGLGRLATGALLTGEGAAMGALGASGESDAELGSEQWRDDVESGTAWGGALSGILYGAPAVAGAAYRGARGLLSDTPEAMARGAARLQEAIGGADEGTAATVGRLLARDADEPVKGASAASGPFGLRLSPPREPTAGPYRTGARSAQTLISEAIDQGDPALLAGVPEADDIRRQMILERAGEIRRNTPVTPADLGMTEGESGTRNIRRRPRPAAAAAPAVEASTPINNFPPPTPGAPQRGPNIERVIAASEGRINQLSPRELRAAAVRGEDPSNRDALLSDMADSLNNLFRLGDEVDESVGRLQVKESTIRRAMEAASPIPEVRQRAASVAQQVNDSIIEMATASGGAISRKQRDALQRLADVAATAEDPAQSFMALDALKRRIGKLRTAANAGLLGQNSHALADDLESVYASLRDHLEDGSVWGQGAARIQREANAAYTPYIPARDALERRFMEADPHRRAVNGWDQAQRADRQRLAGLLDNANAAERFDERADLLRGARQFGDWAETMQRLYAGDSSAANQMRAESQRLLQLIETMQTDSRAANMLRQASEAVGRIGVGRVSLGLPQVVRLLQRYADDPARAIHEPGGRIAASLLPAISRALRPAEAAIGAPEHVRAAAEPETVSDEEFQQMLEALPEGELPEPIEPAPDEDVPAETVSDEEFQRLMAAEFGE